MQNFQVFSRRLHYLFRVMFILFPVLNVLYWLNVENALALGVNHFYIPSKPIVLNSVTKTLGFLLSLFSTFIEMSICYQLCQLFKNYEKGSVFTEENAHYYKKLGHNLFIFSAIQLILPTFMGFIFTFQNPPGQRMLILSLEYVQIFPILIACVISGIAYVMKEAYHLEKEQRLTI